MSHNRGNSQWTKGVSGNPAGKPKGTKNRLTKDVVEQVLTVWKNLERTNKGLFQVASKNPKWFYEVFVKALMPKNIDIRALIQTQHQIDLTSLSTHELITLRQLLDKAGAQLPEPPGAESSEPGGSSLTVINGGGS